MLLSILIFYIEFTVQTVFLTVALWIMIKLQKLDYNLLGLIASATLVSGLDRILDTILGHFVGIYLAASISAPITVTVLIICISKVTHADRVNVLFTIGVGYALMFGMNLWLFGALTGELRSFARNSEIFETVTQQQPQRQPQPETNAVSHTAIKTNPPAPVAPARQAAQPKPGQLVETATNLFSIKGVSRYGAKSAVTIQTGKRVYTILLGESALTQTTNGPVSVRFKQLGEDWVVLAIDGQEIKLPFH